MSAEQDDILEIIPLTDLHKIRDLYANELPYASHVYSFLNTAIRWTKTRPEILTFYAPNGDWSDGTFIALMQFACYDLFAFTLEKNCERLYKGLKNTKRIDWSRHVLFYALHRNHRQAVLKALRENNVPVLSETKTDYWWMPKEKAAVLNPECPDEYCIRILTAEDAHVINDVWPHKYKGSIAYVATFIELNGGHGIFTKSDNKLVSWVLKNQMGTLGLLQTIEEYKRKGLGSIITKSLSKEIALEGHNPLGTVLVNNTASQTMFSKLGFELNDSCSFINTAGEEK